MESGWFVDVCPVRAETCCDWVQTRSLKSSFDHFPFWCLGFDFLEFSNEVMLVISGGHLRNISCFYVRIGRLGVQLGQLHLCLFVTSHFSFDLPLGLYFSKPSSLKRPANRSKHLFDVWNRRLIASLVPLPQLGGLSHQGLLVLLQPVNLFGD